MPFTPSHAVVALPFARTPLAPAAIAVGAMAPDLPLFVRGTPLRYSITHDFAWLPVTTALALVLLLLWRCALRPAARELSPGWLAARLPEQWDAGAAAGVRETFSRRGSTTVSWVGGVLLAAALAIGVASHIAWDLFTHEGRWGSALLPMLDERWGPLTGYTWLQHGSSLVGLVILGVWALLRLRRADAATVDRRLPRWVRRTWWVWLPLALAVAGATAVATHGGLSAEFTPAHVAYQVLLPVCAGWGLATVFLCVAVGVIARRNRNPR